jgi:uncharacterized protein YjbJ (UPF0337 family)
MGEYIDKAKGKAKVIEGELKGDDARKREGEADQIKGNLKGIAHKVESAARSIADTVKGAFKKDSKA